MRSWSQLLTIIGKIYIVLMFIVSIVMGIFFAVEWDSFLYFILISVGGIIFTIISASLLMTFAEIGNNINDIKQKLYAIDQNGFMNFVPDDSKSDKENTQVSENHQINNNESIVAEQKNNENNQPKKADTVTEDVVVKKDVVKKEVIVKEIKERPLTPNQIKCPHCGKVQNKSLKRCLYCGKMVDQS